MRLHAPEELDDEKEHLRCALEQCDNPFILPLLEFALETARRRANSLKLQERDIDIANRHAMMYDTKGGHNHPVPLTQRTPDILEHLPRGASHEQVFATTASALTGAWKRSCARAGITDLHFHDGRHVRTSRHAKRLRSPHMRNRYRFSQNQPHDGNLISFKLGNASCYRLTSRFCILATV